MNKGVGVESLTVTQRKIFDLLSDGNRHSREEIFEKCVYDELAQRTVIRDHICQMRKKIGPIGLLVVCEVYMGKLFYRMSRHLGSTD